MFKALGSLLLAGALAAQSVIVPPMYSGNPPKPATHDTYNQVGHALFSYDWVQFTTFLQADWLPIPRTWGRHEWTSHAISVGAFPYKRGRETVRVWVGTWDGSARTTPDVSKLTLVLDKQIDHGTRPIDGVRRPWDKPFVWDRPYTHTTGAAVLHLEAGEAVSNVPGWLWWWRFEMGYDWQDGKQPWLADQSYADTEVAGCGNLITGVRRFVPFGASLFEVRTTNGVQNAPCMMIFGTPTVVGCARVLGSVFIPSVLVGNSTIFGVPLPQQDFDLHYQFWVLGSDPDPSKALGPGHYLRSRGWTHWTWSSATLAASTVRTFPVSVAVNLTRLR